MLILHAHEKKKPTQNLAFAFKRARLTENTCNTTVSQLHRRTWHCSFLALIIFLLTEHIKYRLSLHHAHNTSWGEKNLIKELLERWLESKEALCSLCL